MMNFMCCASTSSSTGTVNGPATRDKSHQGGPSLLRFLELDRFFSARDDMAFPET